MTLGVILAAGSSSRFNHTSPKQLCDLDGKSLVSHSVGLLSRTLDGVIVVTNSRCLPAIRRDHPDTTIIVNNVNCRIMSIKAALDFIGKKSGLNLAIHDAARPFISEQHVRTLVDSMNDYQHAQYYLKLVNGLARRTETGYETVDRDQYLELVTPQVSDYSTFERVFREYIEKPDREVWEILTVCDRLGIRYNLIEGHHRHLRKVTTSEDLYS